MKAKFVLEVLNEDIIDKVRERRFGILDTSDEFDYYDDNVQTNDKDIIVIEDDVWDGEKWKLIKNPSSLRNFPARVRGIVMKNGDLYLEHKAYHIHSNILDKMVEKGMIHKEDTKRWYKSFPKVFLTIQRDEDTNVLMIGESNEPLVVGWNFEENRVEYDKESREQVRPIYDRFLESAREKHPMIKFSSDVYSR